MTTRKLYAKHYGGHAENWAPGVQIKRDSDTNTIWFNVTYKVYGSGGEERKRRVMKDRIIPALRAADIAGVLSADGLTFRVEE